MRIQRFTKFLGAAAVAVMMSVAAGSYAEAQSIAWRTDLDSATAEARQTGKVMMVDVYTDWCEWCKVLDSKTYTDAKVIAGAQQFVALKLNPEKSSPEARFAQKYGVTGYPTILFVEGDGTLVNRVVGYVDAPSFASAIARTTEYGPKIKTYLAEFKAGTNTNARELLSMLVETGRVDEAIPVFDRLRSSESLPASFQETTALAIARNFLDQNQYDRTLDYVKIVEDIGSRSDANWDAHFLRAIVIYYTKGKTAGIGYLDLLQANTETPSAWKERYKDLENRMKAAKDQGSS